MTIANEIQRLITIADSGGGGYYTDFDGSSAFMDPSDESLEAYRKANELHELIQLRKPIHRVQDLTGFESWGYEMLTGLCQMEWEPE